MRARPPKLTAKFVATGLLFLALALSSVGLTLWVAWKLEGGAAAVNEAGRLRMQAYRLALSVSLPAAADAPRPQELADRFEQSLSLLEHGDASRPLWVPWTPRSQAAFARARQHWGDLRARWLGGASAAHVFSDADVFVADVDALVQDIENEISHWTAILHLSQVALMALAVASTVALLYSGYVLVLQPVARLRAGVAGIQAGDLSTRVEVESSDEFGDLSAGFNEMAGALQALYQNLEAKVQEKTMSLEAKQKRLADLYGMSVLMSEASSLEELGRGFCAQVRRLTHADATAMRWCDEAGQRYVMLASDNLPAGFAEQEACMEAGECGCGQPPASAALRVIPILTGQPEARPHCRAAGFGTVVSVPVRLHERVLGEIDLFFVAEVALGSDDRELLDALAAHLATVMESLRAAALEREAAVAEERSMLARELHDSIAQSLAFMKIQVQLLRGAMQRHDPDASAEILSELDTGVRESYADVRELLMHFRTRTSEEDIGPALRTTLSKFEHHTGLAARLEMEGPAGVPLAPDVQVQVLHILQEALSNVRKHARAREVVLRVRAHPCWRFEVHDDGLGFDPAEDGQGETHVGLRIMRERAERIGATVRVDAARGRGCSVVVELPRGDVTGAVPSPALEVDA